MGIRQASRKNLPDVRRRTDCAANGIHADAMGQVHDTQRRAYEHHVSMGFKALGL
jgi:hypothetical protein